MVTFQELSADNPSLRQQYDEWRQLADNTFVRAAQAITLLAGAQ